MNLAKTERDTKKTELEKVDTELGAAWETVYSKQNLKTTKDRLLQELTDQNLKSTAVTSAKTTNTACVDNYPNCLTEKIACSDAMDALSLFTSYTINHAAKLEEKNFIKDQKTREKTDLQNQKQAAEALKDAAVLALEDPTTGKQKLATLAQDAHT